MRLRNEEEFAGIAIESVIDCLDELVIVHNGCTDRTPGIVESYRLRYPDRIRVFEYRPEVFRPASPEHVNEPVDSPHSLVNYNNYTLAQTTRRVAIKIDGDEVYFSDRFRRLADDIREGTQATPIGVSGINLWDDEGDIFVNAAHPVTSGLDKGFFTVGPQTFFVRHRSYELFTHAFERSAGIFFYHAKGLKRDRGLDNYAVDPGATTFSSQKLVRLSSPALMPLAELRLPTEDSEALPVPAALGLRARHRTP